MKTGTRTLIAAVAVALVGAAGVATFATAHGDREWRGGGHHEMRGGHHGHRMRGHHRGQRRGARMERLMERFDSNGDGSLTQAELDTARTDLLARFDTNADGSLSLEEFGPLWLDVRQRRIVRGFQRLDADGDAVVTVEEFLDPFADAVARMDRNGDGALSADDRRRRGERRRGDDRQAPRPE